MTVIKVEELKELSKFKNDLTLDGKIVVVPRGVPLTQSLIKALSDHFIPTVCTEDKVSDASLLKKEDEDASIENLRESLINDKISEVDGAEFGLPAQSKAPQAKSEKTVATKSEEVSLDDFLDTKKTDAATQPSVVSQSPLAPSDNLNQTLSNQTSPFNSEALLMETNRIRYQEFVKYIQYVYTHFVTHKKIDVTQLSDEARSLAVFIRDNKRYVLRLVSNPHNRAKNFLVIHAMRSTVFAVIMALELKIDITHIRELTMACILHEIGMLRLPPQLYLINRRLVPMERNLIATHPVYGYNILKAQGFPVNVSLAVLEHHEKENGLGYPRRLPSDQISIYAKIINVACSFEAITAPRTYKDEQTTYSAMAELIENPNKQYDENVLKALLSSMSRYPIGAFVYLNNGKVALVVDCNPKNPMMPIVEVVGAKAADGSPLVLMVGEKLKITRALSYIEEESLLKSLGKTAKALKQKDGGEEGDFEKIDPVEFE